jgi:hypothetical protein
LDEKKLNELADKAIAIYKKAKAENDPAANFMNAIRQVVGDNNEAYALVHRILTNRSAAKRRIASLAKRLRAAAT